ncbi:GDSL-type esterase/lipase family protein [uncultured Lactobacillus sp.]|uniref:SGNH/GDSL hydrolase family protein n=1 Tax=uncultured Lactobacillus sp. TaxID=153152 RepID=UPI0026075853|nr:GDSL-type esterase/lipase family protein [uncultured Lactobacillus sp.]
MKKIILFGDSILAGFKDGIPTDAITSALQKRFPQFKILNHSVPGATSQEGLDFLDLRVKPPYDLVVLGLGTNDASVKLGLSAGQYAKNLQDIVDHIGRDKIILMGPSYTNWKVALDQAWPRTLQFELVAKECARRNKLPFLDLAGLLQKRPFPNELLQADGIHLNDDGNKILIDNLANLIEQKL